MTRGRGTSTGTPKLGAPGTIESVVTPALPPPDQVALDPAGKTARYLAARRERARRYRERHRGKMATRRRSYQRTGRGKEWVGIDGEGWSKDELGRQLYPVMVAASDLGFTDVLRVPPDQRLGTFQILEWLCWLRQHYEEWRKGEEIRMGPPRFCGYALGYDYAHVLMDLSLEDLRALFHQQDHESPWVMWPAEPVDGTQFALKLTAGRLQIKRLRRGRPSGRMDLWDVFRYFQSSFIKAADTVMTDAERLVVEAGKARRGQDVPRDVDREIEYALTEMKVLSRLMRTVETQVNALDLHPGSWYGPGSVASLALRDQGMGAYYLADDQFDPGFIDSARRAFVGGRFETTGHGRIPYLMQSDIKSAYPYAITKLPCLAHTTWEHSAAPAGVMPHGLYHLRWANHGQPLAGGWGPWPSRVQPGKAMDDAEFNFQLLPMWPWTGDAWVWGWEYAAGLRLLEHSPAATVQVVEAWLPQTTCDHWPFRWVWEWYRRRQAMQAAGDPRQMWLKLILNSLYGKMAQQVGRAQWHSWIWAGLITSHTRAQLLDAICLDPEGVVMTATDAVYSRRGLPLDIGEGGLGQWEVQALENLLVVQSGFFTADHVYGPRKPRTRGIPPRYIDWSVFQTTWDRVLAGTVPWDLAKVVVDKDQETGEPFQIHVGIGLAQLWGKPEKMGMWEPYPTEITFVTDKRPFQWDEAPATMRSPEWLCTQPWYLPGNPSAEYRPGRGIGEDKLLVMDQANADEWGEI